MFERAKCIVKNSEEDMTEDNTSANENDSYAERFEPDNATKSPFDDDEIPF